jgi:hypothetical protein
MALQASSSIVEYGCTALFRKGFLLLLWNGLLLCRIGRGGGAVYDGTRGSCQSSE